MTSLQETATNTTLQEAFWFKLQQFKFDLFYYCNHYKKCVAILKWIKYIVVGLTTASTLAWIEWSEISSVPKICSAVIIALQVFNAISDFLPFSNRKDELRDLTNDLDPLYIEMESTWRRISNGELSLPDVEHSIDNFARKRLQIEKNYLRNDYLKEYKKMIEKTENQTREYFDALLIGGNENVRS